MTTMFSSYIEGLTDDEKIHYYLICLAKVTTKYNISKEIIDEIAKESLNCIKHNV